MTTTAPAPSPSITSGGHLSFAGILRSEWIKLRSLRSTFWCAIVIVVISIGLTAMISGVLNANVDEASRKLVAQGIANQAVTLPTGFTSLVAAVLGALMITGEFGTGMIRSTFAAVPGRIPALLGKALIVTVFMFVLAAISIVISAFITAGIFGAKGLPVDLGDGQLWLSYLGDALYLAAIGLMSLFIGAIIRNSAGGIAVALGLILVVPLIFNLIAGIVPDAIWASNIGQILPSNAGSRMYAYVPEGVDLPPVVSDDGRLSLDPALGGLVMLAWVAVLGVLAAVLVKRRDA
jgi:ABC-2 type transport system permease protein